MKTLVAEDNPTTLFLLQSALTDWGYEVVAVANGAEAWQRLQEDDSFRLILLDWKMPEMEGVEVCQRLRQLPGREAAYVIILTSKVHKDDLVAGLAAGADDYITKPFDPAELQARLQVGVRIVQLQQSLAERVHELETALAHVKQLHGLLPICAYCKKIRDDHNYWQQVESYISSHSDAQFSHGVCPECFERIVKPELESMHPPPRPGPETRST
jgi:CheY-like chemotaxis protein